MSYDDLHRRAQESPDMLVVVSLADLQTAQRALFEDMRREMFTAVRNMTQAKFMSRKDVCEMLGTTYKTLYTWDQKGILKAHRIGGKVRYKSEDVMKKLNFERR